MIAAPARGLALPSEAAQAPEPPPASVASIGGIVRIGNIGAALQMAREGLMTEAAAQQAQPIVQALVGHVRTFFQQASQARQTVETEMIEAMLARRGQYTAAKLQQISEQRQPAIYMMVASAKMRQIEALLRDVAIGTGAEKPWTLKPTPVPELPPSVVQAAIQQLTQEIEQSIIQGFVPSVMMAQQRLRQMREELMPVLMEEARRKCAAMEDKMEDQLVEGGFLEALDQFVTDLATFKTAFIEGPIVRKQPQLSWGPNGELSVENKLTLTWERRSPFDVYPAPWAKNVTTDPVVVKYRLSRSELNDMIGVDGYSEPAIRQVLEKFDDTGFREYLSIDSQLATAEGKNSSDLNNSGLIDALRYFGTASGRMLKEWGSTDKSITDLDREYQVEVWVAGTVAIKAVLNADPLARRPLYGASFQGVPGSVWGNSPYDLMRDCQDMCNGAARALAANMGIASGPQVAVIANRLPSNENLTEMFPWKIWQFESDPMGSTAAPISFFQPNSNAQELMGVYERFSALADEYTGIPRYMAGFETAGAGRTASGMSMMIGNASKVIKQVLGTVDTYVIGPVLERLYYYNMRYGEDPELKGDVKVVARGAASLATKEAAQVRTNEFLQATANPIDLQIVGMEGRAELLRHAAKRLDLNPDKVVPSETALKQRMMMQQVMAAQQPALDQPGGAAPQKKPDQEQLSNGAPVSDHYSPK